MAYQLAKTNNQKNEVEKTLLDYLQERTDNGKTDAPGQTMLLGFYRQKNTFEGHMSALAISSDKKDIEKAQQLAKTNNQKSNFKKGLQDILKKDITNKNGYDFASKLDKQQKEMEAKQLAEKEKKRIILAEHKIAMEKQIHKFKGKDRFKKSNGVITDLATGFQWQEGLRELRANEAVGFCNELRLDGKEDWRLTGKIEHQFVTYTNPGWREKDHFHTKYSVGYGVQNYKYNTYCVRGVHFDEFDGDYNAFKQYVKKTTENHLLNFINNPNLKGAISPNKYYKPKWKPAGGIITNFGINGSGYITFLHPSSKGFNTRNVEVHGFFKNGYLSGKVTLKVIATKPTGWASYKEFVYKKTINQSSSLKKYINIGLNEVSGERKKSIKREKRVAKEASSSSSSYNPKYGCKFCCEGRWGSCRSDTIQVNTPYINSMDAQNYVRKQYADMCSKYPFHSNGAGSASVSLPNCETYFYKD